MTRLLALIFILSALVGCKKGNSILSSSPSENVPNEPIIVASCGDDESLRKQFSRYRSKVTSATEAECIELQYALDPTDADLKVIYEENAKYAIAIRDANRGKDVESDPEAFRKAIQETQKYGPISEDELKVTVKHHDDFRVLRAQEQGLLKDDFPIRKVIVESPHFTEGYGAMIHVNGRWVRFIPLDNWIIQRAKRRNEQDADDQLPARAESKAE